MCSAPCARAYRGLFLSVFVLRWTEKEMQRSSQTTTRAMRVKRDSRGFHRATTFARGGSVVQRHAASPTWTRTPGAQHSKMTSIVHNTMPAKNNNDNQASYGCSFRCVILVAMPSLSTTYLVGRGCAYLYLVSCGHLLCCPRRGSTPSHLLLRSCAVRGCT